ncbi:hypothetical protein QU487_06385 [Crenobacter sp. SG2305]|uniref:hypothetical protein n=1 Tax=Crenobacter oryzisoli TaxID=3056844 RepID=UPI0025AAFEC6|nr:hypothetical protein [Crenobacter sp. SG2305]MDN0082380.1 hypothetical protein [Crenobacter sp. SG2305]
MSTWIANSSTYYWTGPTGWTICRVVINGRDTFELWQGNGRESGGCRFRGPSLAAAEAAYQDLTGDTADYAERAEGEARMGEAEHPAMAAFMAGRKI